MIRTLRIQLTDICNFSCVYCCHEGTMNEYSILKNRNLISFIRACHDVLGICRVKFTGGEPLEYDEDICDIIKKVDRPNIDYSIVTNGTNAEVLKKLVEEFPNLETTISLPIPLNEMYLPIFHNITGSLNFKYDFKKIKNVIDYMMLNGKSIKINYVLCNGMNTKSKYIKEIIDFAKQNPTVKLRFLETAVNNTNNRNGCMERFVFRQNDFEKILIQIGYEKSVINKYNDIRSSCMYDIDGTTIKLIKFFCGINCTECPSDKSSLWLTSTGHLKICSYGDCHIKIENWQYSQIAKQLEKLIDM
ncbi:MAG: radical SAM protein [Bacilli bacterium]|nr:radical SAM protein [Bacilli bacterium]